MKQKCGKIAYAPHIRYNIKSLCSLDHLYTKYDKRKIGVKMEYMSLIKSYLLILIWQLIQIQLNRLVYALSYHYGVQNLTTDSKPVITGKRRLHFVVLTSDYFLNKCSIFPFYPPLSKDNILSLDGPYKFVFVLLRKK